VERARTDADTLLGEARRDATTIRERTDELRRRVESEVEALHDRSRKEAAEAMRVVGERVDKLVAAATEQLREAEEKAAEIKTTATSEASKVRIAAVKKVEGLLKEAEQNKAEAEREAERVRREARAEADRIVSEGKRELETLTRRREDINAEIGRVQDVLAALEQFEAPGGGAKSSKSTVPAGAASGPGRAGGKRGDEPPLD
jgi:vacuolar-type H+-ATPase subunit E/Vma4